ncbi:MAG: hypothetical protein IKR18_11655 [Bacteroidaceae bacterium]|nr:hypothetical protein [Bacteroidaceae bacterium]
MNETNKSWGGKRDGAGRKRVNSKRIGLSVPDDVVEALSKVGNMSQFIVEAIREKVKREGL